MHLGFYHLINKQMGLKEALQLLILWYRLGATDAIINLHGIYCIDSSQRQLLTS
jgi:hypothetical protein